MSLTICTIGCGSMATAVHGPSYARYAAEHPDTLLAACCDLDAARAETFRARFGFARCYTDIRTMLDAEKPDAVCLVAPVEFTCALSCLILERGLPLLLEKPPGLTVAEIDRMIAVAHASGAAAQVAFNRRFTPLLLRLRTLLQEQVAPGALQHLQLDFTRTGRADPDFSTTAIHGIDAARFLAGSDYREIRFHYQPLPRHGPTVANVFLNAIFENGMTAQLNFCPMAGEVVERVTLHADDQTFRLHLPIGNSRDAPGRLQRMRKNECLLDVPCEITVGGGALFEASGFYGENAAFFDAVRAGTRPEPNLSQVRQSVEVMECFRERVAVYRHKPS